MSVESARFWGTVDQSAGPTACWPWTGARTTRGYGLLPHRYGVAPLYAHRMAYELGKGAIPPKMLVLHACDNPPCVNPLHLFIGTQSDNMRDAARKGRTGFQVNPSKAPRGEQNVRSRLTDSTVRAIRAAAATGEIQQSIADRFGISQATVSRIVLRRGWRHVA